MIRDVDTLIGSKQPNYSVNHTVNFNPHKPGGLQVVRGLKPRATLKPWHWNTTRPDRTLQINFGETLVLKIQYVMHDPWATNKLEPSQT